MLPDDEITSTEQLLTLIRNNDVQNDVNAPPTTKNPIHTIDSEGDHITVGVDIRENDIMLVKIGTASRTNWKLLDCVHQQLPTDDNDGITPNTISQYVRNFIGDTKQYRLWAFVSSEKADVKHILIPKVQEKELTNTIYWTAKKAMEFNEKTSFVDFEILGDITQKGIGRTSVMVYTVPKQQIASTLDLFTNAGYPLSGISIPEFSIQNLLRGDLLSGSGDTIASLSINQTYSKISVYRRGNLTFTRRIKVCLNSMSEALVDSINVMQTEQALSVDYARNLLLKNISQSSEGDDKNDIDQDKIFKGIRPAVERLVRQIERTFQHFNSLYQDEVITQLYIEGQASRFGSLTQYISRELKINVLPLDVVGPGVPQFVDYKVTNPNVAGELITLAIGLTISDYQKSAPNLLFDYQDKERINLNSRINKGIRIGLTIAAILCFCLLMFQIFDSSQNKSEIKALKEQLAAYGPRVDQNLILQEAARMKNLYQSQKKIAAKYLGLATVTELIERNPDYIQLNRIRLDMGPLPDQKRRSKIDKRAIIEGTVFKAKSGQRGRDIFETSLGNYMLSLEKSPIFVKPSIREKSFEHIDRYGEVLLFELHLGIQSQSDIESEE